MVGGGRGCWLSFEGGGVCLEKLDGGGYGMIRACLTDKSLSTNNN